MLSPGPAPYSSNSRASRTGYFFAWFLVFGGGVAGALFALYRNDVLLSLAQKNGYGPLYRKFEASSLGAPGWGTPRQLVDEPGLASSEGVTGPAPLAEVHAPAPSAPQMAVQAAQPAAAAAATSTAALHANSPDTAEPARANSATSNSATSNDGIKIVSLDALAALPASDTRAPAPAAPVPKAAPQVVRSAAATHETGKVVLRESAASEAPAAKSQPAKAPPAPKAAPAPAPADDNPLKAAIRSAITKEARAH